MASKTFIILKPDALERGLVDQIMQRFFNENFQIEHIHYRIVDKLLIHRHYEEVIKREGPAFKEWLGKVFVGKPAISMILSHSSPDAITIVRTMLGHYDPVRASQGTIRGDLGIPASNPKEPVMNLIHASDSPESFEKETDLWFHAPKY